jgi:hypothetical protein
MQAFHEGRREEVAARVDWISYSCSHPSIFYSYKENDTKLAEVLNRILT